MKIILGFVALLVIGFVLVNYNDNLAQHRQNEIDEQACIDRVNQEMDAREIRFGYHAKYVDERLKETQDCWLDNPNNPDSERHYR